MDDDSSPLIGTAAYDNWRAYLAGAPRIGGYEYLIYSDARLTGDVSKGLEPYAFINLVFDLRSGRVRPVVAVRTWIHVKLRYPNLEKTDSTRYHGGDEADELAALASLLCGVRLRAGNQSRRFDIGNDPVGRPVTWGDRPDPVLAVGRRGTVLPRIRGEHSLMPVEELRSFPKLEPQQAISLVRAARLYQDALWLAESEPGLAWLLLVSAVETAANFWTVQDEPPVERLRGAKPEFVDYLESQAVEGLAERVAEEFVASIGATKKFVDFLLKFSPSPPGIRPEPWGQIEWTGPALARAFRQIYGHRSRALHDGVAFPAPMSETPYRHDTWQTVAEKPQGLAQSVAGGSWLAADTPMLLHTFEYIARNALLAWWRSMLPAG